jgi:hypothetical protein
MTSTAVNAKSARVKAAVEARRKGKHVAENEVKGVTVGVLRACGDSSDGGV